MTKDLLRSKLKKVVFYLLLVLMICAFLLLSPKPTVKGIKEQDIYDIILQMKYLSPEQDFNEQRAWEVLCRYNKDVDKCMSYSLKTRS